MEYTFDKFSIGKSNRLAYTAAMKIVANLGHVYNPLFIYGGVDTGKTYLLHAIEHNVLSKNPQIRFCYMLPVKRLSVDLLRL